MNVAKENIPARIDTPDAVARHQPNFGDTTDYGDTLRADADTDFVLSSPQHEHSEVIYHAQNKMARGE